MPKYKPGDRVRVRPDIKASESYGANICTLRMSRHAGKIATVRNFSLGGTQYRLDIDHGICNWTDEMLMPVASEQRQLTDEQLSRIKENSSAFLGLLADS